MAASLLHEESCLGPTAMWLLPSCSVLQHQQLHFSVIITSCLPFQASDKEVQVAQDLGAVDKAVNVAGIHCLKLASGSGSFTG